MSIRTIIADDEPLARERLRTLLAKEEDVEIVAECADGTATIEAVRRHHPDLLLLDIQMPDLDGFGVLRELGAEIPTTIFVTAYDDYAIKAFEVHALDYVLKPFKPARLRQAIERVRGQRARSAESGDIDARIRALIEEHARTAASTYISRIAVRQGERTRFVRTSDIDWFEASGNYLVLHCGQDKPMIRETLGAVEEKLSPRQFFRVSRSAIVNLERVAEVHPGINDEHIIVLACGTRVPLTRGVRELQERLRFL